MLLTLTPAAPAARPPPPASRPPPPASPPPPPRPRLTSHEAQIYEKICEIILTIHKSKEFVFCEHVQQELFRFYRVNSWHELRVQPSRFDAFMNIKDGVLST